MAYPATLATTYSDLADALTQFMNFATNVSYGNWTENTIASGKQITKNIDGTDVYFNLNTVASAVPFNISPQYYIAAYGIALVGSTGTGAGLAWNAQPGSPPHIAGQSTVCGGVIDKIISGGGSCYFFATETTLSAVYQTNSYGNDWRMFTVGAVDGHPFYSISGGSQADDTSNYNYRSNYLGGNGYYYDQGAGQASCYYGGMALFDGTRWCLVSTSSIETYSMYGNCSCNRVSTQYSNKDVRSISGPLLYFSPEMIRGNPVLVPVEICVSQNIGSHIVPVGILEGVALVNTTYIPNGTVIESGGNLYTVFRISHFNTAGAAFLTPTP